MEITWRSLLRGIALIFLILAIVYCILWYWRERSFDPVVNLLLAVSALLTLILSYFASDKPIFVKDTAARAIRNREAMLQLVKNTWIEGFLERSLHGAALIALGLEERMEAVEHPWGLVLQISDQPHRPLPQGAKIADFFDEVGQKLLILGEPGSGKTTMMLDYARDAIERAEKEPEKPIPVVFNLSSWVESQTLDEWLIDELKTKYR